MWPAHGQSALGHGSRSCAGFSEELEGIRSRSVGCVPTYSAGRLSIAVRPAAVTVIMRFLILTGCSAIKPSFRRRWWPGQRCAPWMMRLHWM